jgi:hypothetical protein
MFVLWFTSDTMLYGHNVLTVINWLSESDTAVMLERFCHCFFFSIPSVLILFKSLSQPIIISRNVGLLQRMYFVYFCYSKLCNLFV